MNKLSDDSKKSMTSRIITGACLAAIGIPVIIFGGWFMLIFVLLIAVIAIHEILHAPGDKFNIVVKIFTYVMVLSFIYWMFIKQGNLELMFKENTFVMDNVKVSTMGITVYFLVLMTFSILSEKFTIADVCYLFTIGVFFGLATLSIYFLRYFPDGSNYYGSNDLKSCLLFFYVLIGTFMSDIGAYFTGVLFGKHKMNPRISPKKTWEGFVGGIIFSIAFSFGFAAVCSALNAPILPGVYDFKELRWLNILLVSLIMPITSNLGDFLFSAIKRNYAIKDFGTIFPGHGGVLDRMDSLLVSSLVVDIFTILISNGWSLMI